MNNIFSTTLRLNLDREDDKKALHYLKNADGFSSYSRAVVAAVNDYFDRKEKADADLSLHSFGSSKRSRSNRNVQIRRKNVTSRRDKRRYYFQPVLLSQW